MSVQPSQAHSTHTDPFESALKSALRLICERRHPKDTFTLRLCKYRESISLTRETQLQLAVAKLLHGERTREGENTRTLS